MSMFPLSSHGSDTYPELLELGQVGDVFEFGDLVVAYVQCP